MIRPILFLIAILALFGACLAYDYSVSNGLKSCSKELDKHREDREEVARIEKWIQEQDPRIPSATRRGYAEFTVETGWKIEMEKAP